MPRIEIIPEDWEGSTDQSRGDGTPTIDVCRECGMDFAIGESVDECYPASVFNGGMVGSIDVAHPDYDGCDYKCDCCGEDLTSEDD